jgi:hypothetical protein
MFVGSAHAGERGGGGGGGGVFVGIERGGGGIFSGLGERGACMGVE